LRRIQWVDKDYLTEKDKGEGMKDESQIHPSSVLLPDRYTAQRFDDKLGLYDYRARYYDPHIGRFISADVIVPQSSRLTPLTVGFHETMFLEQANGENRQLMEYGPASGWSGRLKQQLGVPAGPAVPQTLNRFAYVLNNPLGRVDPTGHSSMEITLNAYEAQQFVDFVLGLPGELGAAEILEMIGYGLLTVAAGLAALATILGLSVAGAPGAALSAIYGAISGLYGINFVYTADTLRKIAGQVKDELDASTQTIRITVKAEWWGDRITVNGQNANPAVGSPLFLNQAGQLMRGWMLSGVHNSRVYYTGIGGGTFTIWRADGTFAFP
jgi:RHS repeat-associated protein